MSLLKEATMEQGSAKMAWFGPQGSGKTSSAAQAAIGISKHFHNSAPVAFFDTEKGSDFAQALFKIEGVKLLNVKSRAFSDLIATVKEAEQAGCCALIVDSMSHVWTEIMESFCRKKNIKRIEFQHWRELKATWQTWTDTMLNSKMHMFICGRAGKQYEYQDDDNGKKELITTGTKFKAESEFGYEPDVLVEMWTEREEGTKRGSHLIHKGLVLKDRTWALNGKEFAWKDKPAYKPGDYKLVYGCFEPYFQFLNIGGSGQRQAISSERNSDAMFDGNGDSEYARKHKERLVMLEEISSSMVLLWPGQDQASKRIKILVLEKVFGFRGWSSIEQKTDLQTLQMGLKVIKRFEERSKTEQPSNEDDLLALIDMSREDVETGDESGTLLEKKLSQSIGMAEQKKEAVPF